MARAASGTARSWSNTRGCSASGRNRSRRRQSECGDRSDCGRPASNLHRRRPHRPSGRTCRGWCGRPRCRRTGHRARSTSPVERPGPRAFRCRRRCAGAWRRSTRGSAAGRVCRPGPPGCWSSATRNRATGRRGRRRSKQSTWPAGLSGSTRKASGRRSYTGGGSPFARGARVFVARQPAGGEVRLAEGAIEALTLARPGMLPDDDGVLGAHGTAGFVSAAVGSVPGQVVVSPDRDAAGDVAAERLAEALARARRPFRVERAPAPFTDWNDWAQGLAAGSAAAVEALEREAMRHLTLNEGRGVNPGDTSNDLALRRVRDGFHAQRRPGREPRRHVRNAHSCACSSPNAQRRPGREPRRHLDLSRTPSRRRPAQRRPGREPRRHSDRSTGGSMVMSAQRRPGREPRRHSASIPLMMPSRSPRAQRRPGREPRRHRRRTCAPTRAPRPLNEGRGVNPGDTVAGRVPPLGRRARSTKAGA